MALPFAGIIGLPEQAIGWLPLRFGIGGGSPDDKPTEFSCYNIAKTRR